MCELFDRIVYGIPVPALSLLMAVKALNEARHIREVLRKIKRTRIPKEIVYLIDNALIEGRASESRKEWWDSLKRLLSSSFDEALRFEPEDLLSKEAWLKIMARDLLWEIADSNQCCLTPRKHFPGEEHELVRHLREYLNTLPQKLKIVSGAPLSRHFDFTSRESGATQAGTEEAHEEPIFVVCLPHYILPSDVSSPLIDKEVSDQVEDLEIWNADMLKTTRGVVDRTSIFNDWSEDRINLIRHEFSKFMKDCDIALGNNEASGLASKIDSQLGWWRIAEVVCDCDENFNATWNHPCG